MKIKILGAHNSESLNTRCMSLTVDGVLALDAGGLTSSLSFADQLKLKAVLLTHHHYDHMRDVPALAMNFYLRGKSFDLFAAQNALDNLTKYFLDGGIYPQFHKQPETDPCLRLHPVEPAQEHLIEGYRVTPLGVNHSIQATGYQISSGSGKTLFYTGDTGPELSGLWKQTSPDLLLIEVTAANRWEETAIKNGHLTPGLLETELGRFFDSKGYLPKVITVHMNPESEQEIKTEISAVAAALHANISLGYEGMEIEI